MQPSINKLLVILFFLASCNSKKEENTFNTVVQLKLAPDLPFKKIRLKRFDPLYGSRVSFDYDSSQANDWFEYRLNLTEPTVLYMVDEHNIGAGSLFLHPSDTLSMEITWPRDRPSILNKVITGKYPGDNSLIRVIRDTLNKALETLQKIKNFTSRKAINDFVDAIFQKEVLPLLLDEKRFFTSPTFAQYVLKPEVELQRSTLKNRLLKSHSFEPTATKFYSDSIMAKPNYRFWCSDNLEWQLFGDYIFEVINRSEATDLLSYIRNIENQYRNGDTTSLRIAVCYGLSSYASHALPNALNNFRTNVELNSVCKVYRLNRRKFDYPDYSPIQAPLIESRVLDKLMVTTLDDATARSLIHFINDTAQIYYLDYWASWCRPCVKGLPYTVKLSNANINRLKVLLVNVDDDYNNFRLATSKYHLPPAETVNVVPTESNRSYYKKLNSIEHIPLYQLLFFSGGDWHMMNAYSAADSLLQMQINKVLQALENKKAEP